MTFEGFEPANTTPVPDVLFDELLSELSGSELKAMLYIIRRTLGFKKTADAISLNQFEKGITTKEGKVLDKGCGIKDRHTLLRVLKSLEHKWNCIVSEKVVNEKGECETTLYRIQFRTNGVEEKSTLPVQSGSGKNHTTLEEKSTLPTGGKSTLPVVGKITLTRNSNTRDRLQETVKQEENTSEQTDTPAFVAHATLPPVSENDEEQAATLRALQAGLVASGVLPEPLPIATPEPEVTTSKGKVTQASDHPCYDGCPCHVGGYPESYFPSTPDTKVTQANESETPHERPAPDRDRDRRDLDPAGTLPDSLSPSVVAEKQVTQQELSPTGVDKSQTHGDKSGKDTRAAAKRERDEMTQKRIDAVYAALDTFKQEVMDDPETHFQRTKIGNQKITDLLTLNPTAKKLRKVFYDMWNEKDGKTGDYFWRKHMSPQNVCTHYEARLIGLEGKDKKAPAPTQETRQAALSLVPARMPTREELRKAVY